MAGLAALRRGLGLREAMLRGLHGSGEGGDVAETAGLLLELLLFDRYIGDLLIEPRQPVAMAAHITLELMALRGEIGEHGGQLGEQPFGGGERRFRLRHAFIDAAALLDARLDLV